MTDDRNGCQAKLLGNTVFYTSCTSACDFLTCNTQQLYVSFKIHYSRRTFNVYNLLILRDSYLFCKDYSKPVSWTFLARGSLAELYFRLLFSHPPSCLGGSYGIWMRSNVDRDSTACGPSVPSFRVASVD